MVEKMSKMTLGTACLEAPTVKKREDWFIALTSKIVGCFTLIY